MMRREFAFRERIEFVKHSSPPPQPPSLTSTFIRTPCQSVFILEVLGLLRAVSADRGLISPAEAVAKTRHGPGL
ncbi:hypothetical protein EYF80_012154 [Liparis tanakae]|uniref:Uncharacterized protein n=1 Tax=Liparis tanakae TaxID=230148 RepID=A0A4Z2IJD2_9TELE|nr:hypothetical protein EYF80_012154 [Liparis tanakae]